MELTFVLYEHLRRQEAAGVRVQFQHLDEKKEAFFLSTYTLSVHVGATLCIYAYIFSTRLQAKQRGKRSFCFIVLRWEFGATYRCTRTSAAPFFFFLSQMPHDSTDMNL